MPFPYTLSRQILLIFMVIANLVSLILSATAFHDKTAGVFQVLGICVAIFSLLTVISCHYHQYASWDEEASNTRNMCLFGICGLLGTALAALLTVHAQDAGVGICNDFAHAGQPCVPAGVQLGMAYVAAVFAWTGFVISWIDKFPGAVEVTPRYLITKAPSSHFAAYAHGLDESYTRPPEKAVPRSRNNSGWVDVPLDC